MEVLVCNFLPFYFFQRSYGYYSGPPYKRQRRHSSDDEMAPYGPAFYDPPFVRHQV